MRPGELDELRALVANGCRVLAARQLAPGILGHISCRVDESRMLIRCRGPQEGGLAQTTAKDIRLVDFEGGPGAPGELDGGYIVPYELPLHSRVLMRRPDVVSVVHAHPHNVVALDLAGLPVLPIVGAYDIPGAVLAHGGVPVFPRSALIHNSDLGDEVADALGERPVVLMRGHGLTSTGPTVQEAVLRAVSVDTIALLSLAIVSAGGTLASISDQDLDELPDLGSGLNLGAAWRHEISRLS